MQWCKLLVQIPAVSVSSDLSTSDIIGLDSVCAEVVLCIADTGQRFCCLPARLQEQPPSPPPRSSPSPDRQRRLLRAHQPGETSALEKAELRPMAAVLEMTIAFFS